MIALRDIFVALILPGFVTLWWTAFWAFYLRAWALLGNPPVPVVNDPKLMGNGDSLFLYLFHFVYCPNMFIVFILSVIATPVYRRMRQRITRQQAQVAFALLMISYSVEWIPLMFRPVALFWYID